MLGIIDPFMINLPKVAVFVLFYCSKMFINYEISELPITTHTLQMSDINYI